jgi:hypothetical protein
MILVEAAVHCNHSKAIQCNFKPGSVERSIDLEQKGYTTTIIFRLLLANKNRKNSQWYFCLIRRFENTV